MTIDWTKPVEHVDGTPLVATVDATIACLKREDGKPFADGQYTLRGEYYVVYTYLDGAVERDGSSVIVRNRATLDLAKPLEVFWTTDGVTTVSPVTLTTAKDGEGHVGVRLDEGRTPWGETIYFLPDGTPPRGYEKDAILRNRQPADGFQILRDMGYTCDAEGRWCPPAKVDEGVEFFDTVMLKTGRIGYDDPGTWDEDDRAAIDWLNRVLPAIRAGQDWREVA